MDCKKKISETQVKGCGPVWVWSYRYTVCTGKRYHNPRLVSRWCTAGHGYYCPSIESGERVSAAGVVYSVCRVGNICEKLPWD